MSKVTTWVRSLLGISTYALPPQSGDLALTDAQVEEGRAAYGGQLSPMPLTKTRWHDYDIEDAEREADSGILSSAALLMRSARKDGVLCGVLSTCTDGLVRLPKKFRGDPELVAELEVGHDSVRSVFDEMCPPAELAQLAADGRMLGVAVGELLPVPGRDYPVLTRLNPEWLQYRWNENRWYYRSIFGLIPITPGDGRWVLHLPGGRQAPWQNGLWRAIGKAWLSKEHANLHKSNWEGKLANPARVAVAPQAASEEAQLSWFQKVMAWGMNTVFALKPGWDVRLIESNGRGYESYLETIKNANADIIIAVSGQTVTTDGGAGFANADIHKSIRADIIQATADALAYTINTQVLPPWAAERKGLEALRNCPVVAWDVKPAKDQNNEAQAIMAAGNAMKVLTEALAPHGLKLDAEAYCVRYGIPVKGDEDGDGHPETEPAAAPVTPDGTAPTPEPEEDGSVDVDFSEAA
jgi:hypothetical protein